MAREERDLTDRFDFKRGRFLTDEELAEREERIRKIKARATQGAVDDE